MNTLALTVLIEFLGPCSEVPLLKQKATGEFQNVGQVTAATLEKNQIPFQGTERGLNSAFGTPTGLAAMEVISDHEMKAYGWCYEVDGVEPSVFADEVPVKDVKKIRWVFGYAHMKNGQWISQCTKAYFEKPAFLCKG